MPNDEYDLLSDLLKEKGYSVAEIGKILEYVRRYDQQMKLDSVMDSIGSGRLSLDGLIKDALEEKS